VVNEGLEN
jgi:Ran GTPase-activating protein (RanGAP) involved in mRNA processing and transport